MTRLVDTRDLSFLLYEVGDLERICGVAPFDTFDRHDIESVIHEAQRLAESEFDGLAARLDEHEPELIDGRVINPPELSKALRAYIEMGIPSAPFPVDVGGMGLPTSASLACRLPVEAAGGSTLGYLLLTVAAANMLSVVGSDEQKETFLRPLVEAQWFGTMMLSETEAGSSLGDLGCRARLQPDGTYHLTGSKMWISAGDHDLAENIIHMVLAKIVDDDGAVAGSSGISLFIAPKFLLDEDGRPGTRNGITISGLNHKMGQRGVVNTVPVLGADEPCVGYLVGEPGRGLAGMFHMMNEARIAVGYLASLTGYAGYRYSLAYAKERHQGRQPNADVASAPVPIIEHADVRRMLLAQKAYTEGSLALVFHASELVDRIRLESNTDAESAELEQLLAVLTPMVKTWPSVWCVQANHLAIQVLGGYGYTRDFPVERMLRDNRLNEIHEGTTGIQGLDLVGRKLLRDGGASVDLWLSVLSGFADDATADGLEEFTEALREAIERTRVTARALLDEASAGETERATANATVFLDLCGTVTVAAMWLRMAGAASRALASADLDPADAAFYRGKIAACAYFFRWELPRTETQAALLQSMESTPLTMSPDDF